MRILTKTAATVTTNVVERMSTPLKTITSADDLSELTTAKAVVRTTAMRTPGPHGRLHPPLNVVNSVIGVEVTEVVEIVRRIVAVIVAVGDRGGKRSLLQTRRGLPGSQVRKSSVCVMPRAHNVA